MPILCILSSSNICYKSRTILRTITPFPYWWLQHTAHMREWEGVQFFCLYRSALGWTVDLPRVYPTSGPISVGIVSKPPVIVTPLNTTQKCHEENLTGLGWTWYPRKKKKVKVSANKQSLSKNSRLLMREVWWSENGSCWETETCRRSVKLYRTCSRSW